MVDWSWAHWESIGMGLGGLITGLLSYLGGQRLLSRRTPSPPPAIEEQSPAMIAPPPSSPSPCDELKAKVSQIEGQQNLYVTELAGVRGDIKTLSEDVGEVKTSIARIEGFIEGAQSARKSQDRL